MGPRIVVSGHARRIAEVLGNREVFHVFNAKAGGLRLRAVLEAPVQYDIGRFSRCGLVGLTVQNDNTDGRCARLLIPLDNEPCSTCMLRWVVDYMPRAIFIRRIVAKRVIDNILATTYPCLFIGDHSITAAQLKLRTRCARLSVFGAAVITELYDVVAKKRACAIQGRRMRVPDVRARGHMCPRPAVTRTLSLARL